MNPSFEELVSALEQSGELKSGLLESAFNAAFDGEFNPTQVAALVVALRVRGLTPSMIASAARALRARMIRVPVTAGPALDTCGTGGDGASSLNLSTGAAIICAAAGVRVAKHGNRAASSQTGSADVLAALGVSLSLTPEHEAQLLQEVGISFLFAQNHHPALRHVAEARKQLKVRTLFNVLGPLCNPAGASHQLLGAYADSLRPLLAQALGELGLERAWVVRSEDGLDEMSPFAPTLITELDGGVTRELRLTPEDFGLSYSAPGAIRGGSPVENAEILRAVLQGQAHPSRAAFVLNAAAGLCVAQRLSPQEAAQKATQCLDSGAAFATLQSLSQKSQELAPSPS